VNTTQHGGRASRRRPALSLRPGLLCTLVLMLAGCSLVDGFRRPEGNGGWSPAEQRQQLGDIAQHAGVAYDPAVPAVPPVPRLDLRTALELAAKNNRRIEIARQQLGIAEEQVYDVRGRLLPATTATGRYTWSSDPIRNQLQLPSSAPPGFPSSFVIREKDYGNVNGTVLLPLDITGELRHALLAAQAGYRGEQSRVWATTLEQQIEVVQSYFLYLQARSLREVTEQTIALDQRQLDDAQTRFDAGRATKNDVLVVQVALQDAQQELVRRELDIDRARWNLNQVVGGDVNAPLEVVDVDKPPQLPTDIEVLQLAFDNNPALRTLVQEQQRLDENLISLQRSLLPRPYAGGAVDYSSSEILQPQSYVSGFLGFTWDIDTNTRHLAQIAQARIAGERNRTAIEAQMRDVENAVRSTHRSAEERLSAYATATAAVGQADENLRIRQQQFTAGRAQSTDVLDASRLLALQRSVLATALYQAHTRRAELQQLIGLPLDESIPEQR
jgi:outer membrane protein